MQWPKSFLSKGLLGCAKPKLKYLAKAKMLLLRN